MSENTQFDYNTQFNGFVAHVINLAAKEVLNVFGQVLDDDESETVSNIHDLVNPPPHVTQFNLKTIYNHCPGLVKCTWSAPQSAKAYAGIVKMMQGLSTALAPYEANNSAPPTDEDPATAEAVEYLR